uniref:Uncharacterized protein n=1 Tax=Anguilla anguilla TaxID=7936 RepID=A0A0E9SUQ0_ANGAN
MCVHKCIHIYTHTHTLFQSSCLWVGTMFHSCNVYIQKLNFSGKKVS